MTPLRKRMLEELQLRNYANFTVERYLDVVGQETAAPIQPLRVIRLRDIYAGLPAKDRNVIKLSSPEKMNGAQKVGRFS